MNVLFICDTRPHGHDYGVDWLIQGAYNVLGADRVFEYPQKPNLHLGPFEARDRCGIASDAWLPRKDDDAWRQITPDLVIITTAYGLPDIPSFPPSVPVVGLHYDDEAHDTRPILQHRLGRPVDAYWHREHPPDGVRKLWLSQPRTRVRPVQFKRPMREVFYYGAGHRLATRMKMRDELCADHPDWCFLTDTQENRLTCEEYRERLWETRISPVWNSGLGFPVWDSNRLWESLASGCAVVAERPSGAVPMLDGVLYVDTPEDIASVCRQLAANPALATSCASRSQASFLYHHTSEHLFANIVDSVLNREANKEDE